MIRSPFKGDKLIETELDNGHKEYCTKFCDERVERKLLDKEPQASCAQCATNHPDPVEARKAQEEMIADLKVEEVVPDEVVDDAEGNADEIGELIVKPDKRRQCGVCKKVERRTRAPDHTVDDEFTVLLKKH